MKFLFGENVQINVRISRFFFLQLKKSSSIFTNKVHPAISVYFSESVTKRSDKKKTPEGFLTHKDYTEVPNSRGQRLAEQRTDAARPRPRHSPSRPPPPLALPAAPPLMGAPPPLPILITQTARDQSQRVSSLAVCESGDSDWLAVRPAAGSGESPTLAQNPCGCNHCRRSDLRTDRSHYKHASLAPLDHPRARNYRPYARSPEEPMSCGATRDQSVWLPTLSVAKSL